MRFACVFLNDNFLALVGMNQENTANIITMIPSRIIEQFSISVFQLFTLSHQMLLLTRLTCTRDLGCGIWIFAS